MEGIRDGARHTAFGLSILAWVLMAGMAQDLGEKLERRQKQTRHSTENVLTTSANKLAPLTFTSGAVLESDQSQGTAQKFPFRLRLFSLTFGATSVTTRDRHAGAIQF
eukprot:4014209-Amphidinium_carterae.2